MVASAVVGLGKHNASHFQECGWCIFSLIAESVPLTSAAGLDLNQARAGRSSFQRLDAICSTPIKITVLAAMINVAVKSKQVW